MAEENQQQVPQVTTREPQQVTTKNPKKVEAGTGLAEHSRRKREAKKLEELKSRVNQYIMALGLF